MKRTTAHLYDENYYKAKYKTWMVDLNAENPVIKRETEKKYNFIKQYMPDVKSVLIPGCSFGFLVQMFRENECETVGIDVSPYVLNAAPTIIKPYLKEMNVTKLDFPNDHFELVAAFDIMEHLYFEEIVQAVEEVCRVASKYILIRVPVPYYDAELSISDYSSYRCIDKGHVSVYPWDFWARRMIKSGKFQFWFASLWGREAEISCETWITFRRSQEWKDL